MKAVRFSYRVLHLQGPGNAPSDVLLFLPLVDIHDIGLRPDLYFGEIIIFWVLYGLIGSHGQKGIYLGVFCPVVHHWFGGP